MLLSGTALNFCSGVNGSNGLLFIKSALQASEIAGDSYLSIDPNPGANTVAQHSQDVAVLHIYPQKSLQFELNKFSWK